MGAWEGAAPETSTELKSGGGLVLRSKIRGWLLGQMIEIGRAELGQPRAVATHYPFQCCAEESVLVNETEDTNQYSGQH